MKILSTGQVRAADEYTIHHEPVTPHQLMERASRKCADRISSLFDRTYSIFIIAGPGNNGGDGLAIARMLSRRGRKVTVVIYGEGGSAERLANLDQLRETDAEVIMLREETEIPSFPHNGIIIDALLGSGISRPVEGKAAALIQAVNRSAAFVISIDMPSGLPGEPRDHCDGPIVHADLTLTFQCPKLSLLLPATGHFSKRFEVLDIGLDTRFIEDLTCLEYFITRKDIKSVLPSRSTFTHKGAQGHVLVVAGSVGMAGAAILCARGALRGGAGKVSVALPEKIVKIVQTAVPEAMVIPCGDEFISALPDLKLFDAIVAGPGLHTHVETEKIIKKLLQSYTGPLILDADACNMLAANPTWFEYMPARTILTPHPGEMSRLLMAARLSEGIESLRSFARKYKVHVLRKGAYSCTAVPDGRLYFNSTGNPGMATAGSGDVLAGLIGALAAGGLPETFSAVAGAYLHGLAGDLVAKVNGETGILAGDIAGHIPAARKTTS